MQYWNNGSLSIYVTDDVRREVDDSVRSFFPSEVYVVITHGWQKVAAQAKLESIEVEFDKLYGDIEDDLKTLVKKLHEIDGVSAVSGVIEYTGDYDGEYHIEDWEISTLDIKDVYVRKASDEVLIEELKERGYVVRKEKDENGLIIPPLEVLTAAGVLRAYQSADPGQPGISVVLNPAGYEEEIDVSYVSVFEDPEYATEDNERPVDVVILSYGDATTEDYSVKEIIRREDVIAGLGTAAHV